MLCGARTGDLVTQCICTLRAELVGTICCAQDANVFTSIGEPGTYVMYVCVNIHASSTREEIIMHTIKSLNNCFFRSWENHALKYPESLKTNKEKTDLKSSRRCLVEIRPLEDLALSKFLNLLEAAVGRIAARQTVSGFSPQSATLALHSECRSSIPASLRQNLVDLVVSSGRVYNTIDLLLLEVLVAPDIKRLAVRHVRKWYRERFLQLLKSRGSGLRVLNLEDIIVPSSSLSSTFSTLPSLTHLTLRFACDDATLWHVGKGCPMLQELDVEGSLRVTDLGVRALCLKGMPQPQTEEAAKEEVDQFRGFQLNFGTNCVVVVEGVHLGMPSLACPGGGLVLCVDQGRIRVVEP